MGREEDRHNRDGTAEERDFPRRIDRPASTEELARKPAKTDSAERSHEVEQRGPVTDGNEVELITLLQKIREKEHVDAPHRPGENARGEIGPHGAVAQQR